VKIFKRIASTGNGKQHDLTEIAGYSHFERTIGQGQKTDAAKLGSGRAGRACAPA
jgi:hypothetical protein